MQDFSLFLNESNLQVKKKSQTHFNNNKHSVSKGLGKEKGPRNQGSALKFTESTLGKILGSCPNMHIIRKESEFSHICVHAFICVILMPLPPRGQLPPALMTGNNPFTDTHTSQQFCSEGALSAPPVPVLKELSASSIDPEVQFWSCLSELHAAHRKNWSGLYGLVNINIS